ncbi:hypothetical protein VTK73DRAFT_3170 [Phialemonium thermophilum]|uniref:PLD phosphodiesterase domain-containing protein n=1 Tax=Phialemonium thermophilum TaxID=223376 RepID=A0ABR3VK37_9PEZI
MAICFSSRSLLQKLLHTSSPEGYVYPPSTWPGTLGLPTEDVLRAGRIDLTVKSLFFLPFSVMHPKFVVVDRERAFVPSCNISWEAWLEGCVEIRGPAVARLLRFYAETWDRGLDVRRALPGPPSEAAQTTGTAATATATSTNVEVRPVMARSHSIQTFSSPHYQRVKTVILPAPHCRNPSFRPFPWQSHPPAPPKPLNAALLRLFGDATDHIYVQTPNLTSEPAISALLSALERGVHVTIVTSRNMMMLEQLVTAGTLTSWCLRSLVRRYQAMRGSGPDQRDRGDESAVLEDDDEDDDEAQEQEQRDLEAQTPRAGRLRVSYFRPQAVAAAPGESGTDASEEPVHSHLKLTIVDGRFTVLGSGNMDRASWFTSQELGILFDSRDFAAVVGRSVARVLEDRVDVVFDSGRSAAK